MSWNNITNPNKIYVGQKLTLKPAQDVWISYTVRSGDNLSKIAQKNNCTISDLKSWNGIKGNTISAGQKLKIKELIFFSALALIPRNSNAATNSYNTFMTPLKDLCEGFTRMGTDKAFLELNGSVASCGTANA